MEHWAAHFRYYDLFQMSFSKYRKMLRFHKESLSNCSRILDSGAGTGNLTLMLLEEGHRVTAIDNNSQALDVLKNKCSNYSSNLEIVGADLTEPMRIESSSFEGAASCLVIPFIKNIELYLSEIYRVLKKGGVLSLSVPLPKEEIMEYTMSNTKLDAEKEGILPKHEKRWAEIWKTAKSNFDMILERKIDEKKVLDCLRSIGFKQIKIVKDNPYDGFFLFLSCTK